MEVTVKLSVKQLLVDRIGHMQMQLSFSSGMQF